MVTRSLVAALASTLALASSPPLNHQHVLHNYSLDSMAPPPSWLDQLDLNEHPFPVFLETVEENENDKDVYSGSIDDIRNKIGAFLHLCKLEAEQRLKEQDARHERQVFQSKEVQPFQTELEKQEARRRVRLGLRDTRWDECRPARKRSSSFSPSTIRHIKKPRHETAEMPARFEHVDFMEEHHFVYKCPYGSSSRMAIFNLTSCTTNRDIYQVCIKYGPIRNLWMVSDGRRNHENCVMVDFESDAGMVAALRGLRGVNIDGHNIGVTRAFSQFDRSKRKLKLTYRDCPLGKDEVKDLLSYAYLKENCGFGLFSYLQFKKYSVHAFLVFNDQHHAERAERHYCDLNFDVKFIL